MQFLNGHFLYRILNDYRYKILHHTQVGVYYSKHKSEIHLIYLAAPQCYKVIHFLNILLHALNCFFNVGVMLRTVWKMMSILVDEQI
jgi:hypothetical protein